MSDSDGDYLPSGGEGEEDEEEYEVYTSTSSSSSDEGGRGGGGGGHARRAPPALVVDAAAAAAAARRSARLARRGGGGGGASATPAPPVRRPTPAVAATPLAQEVGLRSSARLEGAVGAPGGPPTPPCPPPVALLRAREAARTGARPGWAPCQRAHLAGGAFAPRAPAAVVDAMHSRVYVAFFSATGNKFVVGYQDRRLRVFDASPDSGPAVGAAAAAPPGPASSSGGAAPGGVVPGYPLLKDVSCRLVRWCITDVALSPDEGVAAYSSINPVAHVVRLEGGGVRSVANTTDVHAACPLDEVDGAPPDARLPPFGVWALRFAPGSGGGGTSSTLVAGVAGGRVILHDVERAKTTAVLRAHGDEWDVNALCFLDADRPHVFATGADDGLVKLVDVRVGGGGGGGGGGRGGGGGGGGRGGGPAAATSAAEAAAGGGGAAVSLLAGHLAGITFLDARGDGRTLLSNSKDQTAKLWDVRVASAGGGGGGGPGTPAEAAALAPVVAAGGHDFDYRWMHVPRRLAHGSHSADASVATYRGHSVASTLIRARFSPPGPTGGAYVYSGSADGVACVWDLVTAERVATLSYHAEAVRDISWHPADPSVLVTSSFDGTCVRWGPAGEAGGVPGAAGGDALEDRF